MRRRFLPGLFFLCCALWLPSAPVVAQNDAASMAAMDEWTIVFPSQRIHMNLAEGGFVSGDLTFFNQAGLRMEVEGEERVYAWADFTPTSAQMVLQKQHSMTTGEGWLAIGRSLATVPNAEPNARTCFDMAERLDPGLAEAVARAREALDAELAARAEAEAQADAAAEARDEKVAVDGDGVEPGREIWNDAWPLDEATGSTRGGRLLREAMSLQRLDEPASVDLSHENRSAQMRITAYSLRWLDLLDSRGGSVRQPWMALPPPLAVRVIDLVVPGDDADRLAQAGLILAAMPQSRLDAQRLFDRAVSLDPGLAPAIEGALSVLDEHRERFLSFAPPWPPLTDDQRERLTGSLKDEVDATLDRLGLELEVMETEFWVMYSDLPPHERRKWLTQLDQMYIRVLSMFDLPKDLNIWHGKCVVFVFARQEDYASFFQSFFGQPPIPHAKGICTQFPDGRVYVTFFHERGEDDAEFGHVFVHEATHGVIHRLYSPVVIPNWLNEGMAEYWAYRINGYAQRIRFGQRMARERVRQSGDLDGFFEKPNIDPWQYGLAYDFVDYLLARNKVGLFDTFRAIKRGEPVSLAFREAYGSDLDRVFARYARERLGMRVEP